jgi:peroxiredoxin
MHGWLTLFSGPSAVLILLGGVAILFLLYQIIKQQGRLLLRLDGIEEQLRSSAPSAKPAAAVGLPVGTAFPSFRLPDLEGKEVSLEELAGKRVLLVNWSPGCGFCLKIAAGLAQLKPAFRAHNVALLMLSSGDLDANRKVAVEHGLEGSVLLLKDAPALSAFEGFGTPVAYLLDEKARVSRPLAVGADRVPVLARYAVGEATEEELGILPASAAKKGTCGQGSASQPSVREAPGEGPGTELKKMLGKLGIAVTADCPCEERAATMDCKGWAWCGQNLDTIVGWMREEAARREILFVGFAARFLVRRAVTKARLKEERTQLRPAAGISAAQARTL